LVKKIHQTTKAGLPPNDMGEEKRKENLILLGLREMGDW